MFSFVLERKHISFIVSENNSLSSNTYRFDFFCRHVMICTILWNKTKVLFCSRVCVRAIFVSESNKFCKNSIKMGNSSKCYKKYLQLCAFMLVVNQSSGAAIAQDENLSDTSASQAANEPSSIKPDFNSRPLIPPSLVSANIAQLSPSMNIPKRQSQIIIR